LAYTLPEVATISQQQLSRQQVAELVSAHGTYIGGYAAQNNEHKQQPTGQPGECLGWREGWQGVRSVLPHQQHAGKP
jgi:hypothetical protein